MIALPPVPLLTSFVLASLLLAISPGPGVLYIVTRSLVHGRRSGLISALAMALGNLVCGLVVALGLTLITGRSSALLTTLRYAGAAYLVYLGIRMMIATPRDQPDAPRVAQHRVFVDGMLVALLNPKTLVFFAALLPQFMDASRALLPQGCLLVTLFVLIAWITDSGYALVSAGVAATLQRSGRARAVGRWLGGAVLVMLGIGAVLVRCDGRAFQP